MRVLFIGHEDYVNGASRSLLNIIDSIIDDNEIYVLTSYNNGEFYDELMKRKLNIIVKPFYRWSVTKSGKIDWIIKKIKWNLKHRLINEITANELAKFVKEKQIDIIHSNTSVINIGGLISYKSGIPHIWHLREFGDLDFSMYPLINKKKFFEFMNSTTNFFICISKSIYKHYYLLDKTKKVIVYNGVSDEYDVSFIENRGNIFRFLISGRISDEKGQHEAISACKELINFSVDNFELYIAGSGSYNYPIEKELEGKIIFLGPVKNMSELRKKMDVELVCSKAEAFGRVTAEAMMSSMPVIGSNTGGTPELVIDGYNGYTYQYGDKLDLANKMMSIMDRSTIKQLGKNAHIYARKHFTIGRCSQEIIDVYRKAMISRKKR